jgi:hypothetical protein
MLNKEDILNKLKREGGNIQTKIAPSSKKMRIEDSLSLKSFSSRPEAYTYIIYMLREWRENYSGNVVALLDDCIEFFKISYENHEQDVAVLEQKLSGIKGLSYSHQKELEIIKESLATISNNNSNDSNVLSRRFESELACQLIKSPTKKMMEVIQDLSNAIIQLIEVYRDFDDKLYVEGLDFFLKELEGSDIVFGSFKEKPTLDKVIAILKENNPKDFVKIQFIAFMFSRSVIGPLPLTNLPPQNPTGLFQKILDNYLKTVEVQKEDEFFSYQIMAAKEDGYAFRTFIPSKLFYGDELYTQGVNRGRKGPRKTHLNTNQLGLMKLEQSAHSKGLDFIPDQIWCADAQAQDADEHSIYYTTALGNDCPYITGPSGMSGFFINSLFLLLNPQQIESIQAYSLGMIAYIVGAGFHSINEIVIPLVKCVDLLPDYPVYQGLDYLKSPPLYNIYFKTVGKFDHEFTELREQTWENYLDYFESDYIPLCMNDFCEETLVLSHPEVDILQQIINKSIDNCIQYHAQNNTTNLNFLPPQSPDSVVLSQLKERCSEQSSVPGIMVQLQKYFAGEYTTLSSNMHKFENHSYIRFFIDILKDYPQILAHLNIGLKLDSPLIISSNSEIFSSSFKTECFKIHKMLREESVTGCSEELQSLGMKNI